MLWSAAAKEKEAREVAVVQAEPVKTEAKTPDIPPYIAKCVRYGLSLSKQQQAKASKMAKAPAAKEGKSVGVGAAAKPSADALVTMELKTADEQKACAKAVLDYYRSIQKANQKAAAGKAKTS